jgi:hypothetical protein
MAKNIRNALPNLVANSRRANSPLPVLLVGLAVLVFWVLASVLQIQTSEAFILKGPVVTFAPNWDILRQPFDLMGGHLKSDTAKAAMWGWGIELIFLVCIVGYEVAHESIKASNRHLASWFRTGVIALIAFDAYTDFQYGNLASGPGGQFAFAAVTAFIVAFFGIVGVRLIEHGLTQWSR